LDGPNFGFAQRMGQDAKVDATRSERVLPKGLSGRGRIRVTKFIAKMEPERLASSALEIAEAARERLKAKAK
jgi:hypothetical protein